MLRFEHMPLPLEGAQYQRPEISLKLRMTKASRFSTTLPHPSENRDL